MEIIARPLLEAHDFSIYSNKVIFRQSGRNQREQKTRVLKDSSMSGIRGWVWCCLFGAMGGQWLELAWIQVLLQLSDSANCLSYRGVGMGDEQGTLNASLLSKTQKMGCCLNISVIESIFLHLQVKSLPLPKAAHHCLTNTQRCTCASKASPCFLFRWNFSQRICAREMVLQCSKRCRALSRAPVRPTVFSPELRLFKVMAKGQSTSQMISQSTAQGICPCCSKHRLLWCVSGSSHPDR